MKLTNSLIITALLGLFILPACGSNHSSNQKDSANAEQSVASGKEDVQQCALGLIRIEEEIAFEAILRDGKAWLRFPRSLREKIWDAYPIEEAPVPPFHYSANDEYEVSGLTDCAKIVFINRGQHQDNPMLYFIQKDGTVKVLSFLRAIWFGDFEALRHPTPQSEVADVVSRDEEETGYRSGDRLSLRFCHPKEWRRGGIGYVSLHNHTCRRTEKLRWLAQKRACRHRRLPHFLRNKEPKRTLARGSCR